MNIPIPEELTFWERHRGMHIPITGPQSSKTKKEVMSHGEATKSPESTQAPALQVPQDQKAMDHGLATKVDTIGDGRTTEKTSKAQDSPAPVEARRLDEPTRFHKVLFYMVPSAFVSLLVRVIGYKGKAEDRRSNHSEGCQDSMSSTTAGGQVM